MAMCMHAGVVSQEECPYCTPAPTEAERTLAERIWRDAAAAFFREEGASRLRMTEEEVEYRRALAIAAISRVLAERDAKFEELLAAAEEMADGVDSHFGNGFSTQRLREAIRKCRSAK